MYARVHNITNVGGRKKYVKEKDNREEVVGFYQTASDDFWKMLARENQEQFKRSINSKNKKFKASEAREIVFGLPPYADDDTTARILATKVKLKFGVECIVAIHKKWTRNETGEKILNVHAHIIFSERTLLQEPIHVEEKRAARNYYYDEKGRQCKKTEAVKVTKKGTITQEAHTRYFSNKMNFFNFKTLEPLINDFSKQFSMEKFDIEKHFPQRKIGKNNPKEKVLLEYNKLVKEMNLFFDEHASEGSEQPLKKVFCEKFNVTQRFGVNRIEEIRSFFENFKRSLERSEERLSESEIESLYSDLKVLQTEEKEIETDIQMTGFVLDANGNDFVETLQARAYQNTIEDKYNVFLDNALLEYLKEKLQEIKESIKNILSTLKKSGAEVPQEQNKEFAQNNKTEQEL